MYVATSLSKMCNLKHICEEMIKICMLLQIMGNMGNFSITIIVNFSGLIYIFWWGEDEWPNVTKKMFVAKARKF